MTIHSKEQRKQRKLTNILSLRESNVRAAFSGKILGNCLLLC